jgi:hypothetical protein
MYRQPRRVTGATAFRICDEFDSEVGEDLAQLRTVRRHRIHSLARMVIASYGVSADGDVTIKLFCSRVSRINTCSFVSLRATLESVHGICASFNAAQGAPTVAMCRSQRRRNCDGRTDIWDLGPIYKPKSIWKMFTLALQQPSHRVD